MFSYRVKVRAKTYLYGGEGLTAANHNARLALFFRVEEIGEQIRFGVRKKQDGQLEDVGVLKPGESYAVELRDITGVYAICRDAEDTHVECTVLSTFHD